MGSAAGVEDGASQGCPAPGRSSAAAAKIGLQVKEPEARSAGSEGADPDRTAKPQMKIQENRSLSQRGS